MQGVSGTDDTRHTLPLSLERQFAEGTSTRLTDAGNFAMLLQASKVSVQRLPAHADSSNGLAAGTGHLGLQLLQMALDAKVQAVIDAGARLVTLDPCCTLSIDRFVSAPSPQQHSQVVGSIL